MPESESNAAQVLLVHAEAAYAAGILSMDAIESVRELAQAGWWARDIVQFKGDMQRGIIACRTMKHAELAQNLDRAYMCWLRS